MELFANPVQGNFSILRYQVSYLTAPASMNANPHCMKKMMMDMMSRKKWSISFGFERLS